MGAKFDINKIGEVWNMKEKVLHIKCKELLAVYYCLRSFKTYFQNKHAELRDTEWMLNSAIFQKAIRHLKVKPDLNCFGSRLNTQVPNYISCKPDPYAYLIDAFSIHWGFYNCYLFPPPNLIGQTLQKICSDQTEVVLVVSKKLTQP